MIGQPEIRNATARGPFLIVCEHASNTFPESFGELGLGPDARESHIAWDPGAIGVARRLSDLLDSPMVAATVSRVIYDCNRPPDSESAMPIRSEVYEIPGNCELGVEERIERTRSLYLPFQVTVARQLAEMLAERRRPVLVSVHSFTPIWFGERREVEFGIIHDLDARFAEALLEAAGDLPLKTALNEPYSAADGVAHTLRLHATPHDLPHAMLEIRNDLIADSQSRDRMAADLAAILRTALENTAPEKESA